MPRLTDLRSDRRSASREAIRFGGAELPPASKSQLSVLAANTGKAVLISPVFDTIKLANNGAVDRTLDRTRHRWPVAWAYREDHAPAAEPPEAGWYRGAAVLEQ